MSKRRNIVFVSLGDENAVASWATAPRDYSLAIAHFGDIAQDDLRELADYYLSSKGYKFENFLKCVEAYPGILDHDYFFFVDDDIVLCPAAVDQVFSLCRQHRLDACQPALTAASTFKWAHTAQDVNKHLEYTNLVEIQCFCVSKYLLTRLLPLLPIIKTGWGLDLVFWKLLDFRTDRMAILHAVGMYHPVRNGTKVSQTLPDFNRVSRQVELSLSKALGGPEEPLFKTFEVQSFGSIAARERGATRCQGTTHGGQ